MKKMSAFKAFEASKLTFEESEEKIKKEAGAPRVNRFRIGEDGEYAIRILPLAPSFDAEGNILPMDRKGYDYPLHQQFLKITVPSKKGKSKKINIPVIRTTDKEVGHSVDLIDTYVKIAREMYADDPELVEHIGSGSFEGGLKWQFQHAMMVLDVSSDKERAKGPQLWQCSHSQYKSISTAGQRLWVELRSDGEQETCPISWFENAYPIKIIRTTEKKTEYNIEIGRKVLNVKEEEADKLLELPRIPELIFRYTRYQFEATLEFLKQYDQTHDIEVCQEPDFIAAVEKLKGELPADDNSHFDLAGASSKGSEKEEVTIDSLWAEYDAIIDQDLSERSDEYQDLREKIRQFIEDKELDVRISRTKNNQALLEEVEEALESAKKTAKKETAPAKEETPKRTPRPKAQPEPEPELEVEEDDGDEDPEPEAEPEPEPEPVRPRRRARPGTEEAEAEKESEDEPKEEAKEAEEEQPRRSRLHARRMR